MRPEPPGSVQITPLPNQRGDIIAIVDASDTQNPDEWEIVERYRYTDYGHPLIEPVLASGMDEVSRNREREVINPRLRRRF